MSIKHTLVSFSLAGALLFSASAFSQNPSPAPWGSSEAPKPAPAASPAAALPSPAAPVQPAQPIPPVERKIEGNYSVRGTNPGGGGSYQGTVTIQKQGDRFRVSWRVGSSYEGVGTLQGNQFNVIWGTPQAPVGIVKYTIDANGGMSGTWYTYENPNALGTETLTPNP